MCIQIESLLGAEPKKFSRNENASSAELEAFSRWRPLQ